MNNSYKKSHQKNLVKKEKKNPQKHIVKELSSLIEPSNKGSEPSLGISLFNYSNEMERAYRNSNLIMYDNFESGGCSSGR